jgi:hypothetical protein
MGTADLKGRSILVVEDQPLIALNIIEGFRNAGASVLSARNLRDGLHWPAIPICRPLCSTSASVTGTAPLCAHVSLSEASRSSCIAVTPMWTLPVMLAS